MKVLRGSRVGETGRPGEYGGSTRSKRSGRRAAASISMDGSVSEHEADADIGPDDEMDMVIAREYASTGDTIMTTKRRSPRKSRSAGVAMDGHVRSFDGSCSTQQTTGMLRSSSSGSSVHDSFDESENHPSSATAGKRNALVIVDDNISFSSKDEVDKSTTSNRKWILFILGALILISSVALIVVFTTRDDATAGQSNMATISTVKNQGKAGCQPFRIKDTMEPQLELYMSGLPRLMNETEIDEVQRLVLVEYNSVSGGCADEFERWMYSVTMVNQTLTNQVTLAETAGSASEGALENDLDNDFTLVALFRTLISCNGCTGDSAFATEFPTSFGNATVITDMTGVRSLQGELRDSGSSKEVSTASQHVRGMSPPSPHAAMDNRKLQEGLVTLDAAQIMKAIEIAVVNRIEGIHAIVGAKIFSVSRGEIINTRKIGSGEKSSR